MKKISIIASMIAGALLVTLLPNQSQAQQGVTKLNIGYNIASPLGSFKDEVNKTSFRGWTANVLYGLTDKISIGLGTGYQDFYQKYPRANYKLEEGGDISAVVSNSIQVVPILATGQYNFLPEGRVQPYAGVGVGGNLVFYRQFLGEFSNSKTKFGFAVRPEAGLYIPFGKQSRSGITLNANYNYMPFNYNGVKQLSNWGGGIGVKFPLE
ncbi:outer membrane beta-barrel protein [Pseudoflavitalea rhizosphaerae]|uniref:outer membrane beta-barrel protein n=1 Tax=Pseudoflavitalea rhizosphaerae TaxID=1884793 RepID=UPI000F8EB8E9|nr:outer membrane beta-barrel protein [Pseudoflavitalea rhizosphaerae]